MAAAMQQDFPEIESTTRLMKLFQDDKTLLQYQHGNSIKSFYEDRGYMADSTFFNLFTYHFNEGNGAIALSQPNSVVIPEEIAQKLCGKESALNREIHSNRTTNGAYNLKVTGVFTISKSLTH